MQPKARRTIERRRSLPSGRAVTGGFLVALAGLGVFVAASRTSPSATRGYVVAARAIAPGTTLTAADLKLAPLVLPGDVAAHAYTQTAAVVGHVVVAPLTTDELVQSGIVLGGDAADRRVQLSIPVERARAVDGLLQPGETVDVYATYGTGDVGRTLVVARRAEVRRVDNGSHGAISAGADTVLVLAVADATEALAVSHAAQVGKITIVRATAVGGQAPTSAYEPPRPAGG